MKHDALAHKSLNVTLNVNSEYKIFSLKIKLYFMFTFLFAVKRIAWTLLIESTSQKRKIERQKATLKLKIIFRYAEKNKNKNKLNQRSVENDVKIKRERNPAKDFATTTQKK